MNITRKLGTTDVRYKIICAGSQFDVGVGKSVFVKYNGKLYSAKMHNKSKGRIDGLSALYADAGFLEGQEISLDYSVNTNVIEVTCEKSLNKIYDNSIFISQDVSKLENVDISDVKIDFASSFICKPIGNWILVNEEPLGLGYEKEWCNLPTNSVMKAYSGGQPAACSEEYVVVYKRQKICVFSRHSYSVKIIDTKKLFKEEYIDARSCTLLGEVFYFTNGKKIFAVDIINEVAKVVMEFSKQWVSNLNVVNGNIVYLLTKMNDEDEITNAELVYVDEKIRVPKTIRGRNIQIVGTGKDKVLLRGNGYWVYNIIDRTFTTLYEYVFLNDTRVMQNVYKIKDRVELIDSNVYAVDLESNVVVLYDFPALLGENYQKNTCIKIVNGKVYRLNQVLRKRNRVYQDDWNPHICGNVYRDIYGHEVAILDSYELGYLGRNNIVHKLFMTHGGSVPEYFCMVDNHTAIVKTNEYEVTIVDFALDVKYKINIEDY